ncbi:hypothetical protein CLV58_13030 [Spirosoma oryzae]|uniref:Lipoprotein n=1 Tax=Spirosoma oryzae TaxID=1469603 RepID=A0A2T0S4F4_9BACT|nr:hypothetical protein [Spirosoma oryzae]PRY28173.1 hypothetical protein CLV58_13030 [Spirosoma oryzae]
MLKTLPCCCLLVYLLTACALSNHSDDQGDYYLHYKNGRVLSETDSTSQVYIRLRGDGTYTIKDARGSEEGRWKTIDYDILITYFYPNYLCALLRVGEVGDCVINTAPSDLETKVFTGINWHKPGRLADRSKDQVLFCQSKKVLAPNDLSAILTMNYGNVLRKADVK